MKIRTLLIALGIAVVTSMNAVAGGLLSPKAADNQSKVVCGYNSDPNLTATGLQSAPPHVVESKEKIVPGKSVAVTSSITSARHLSGSPKMIGECVNNGDGTTSCCSPTAIMK
jgi:hypothetical protein